MKNIEDIRKNANETWYQSKTKEKESMLMERSAELCPDSKKASELFKKSAELLNESSVLREKAQALYAQLPPDHPENHHPAESPFKTIQ